MCHIIIRKLQKCRMAQNINGININWIDCKAKSKGGMVIYIIRVLSIFFFWFHHRQIKYSLNHSHSNESVYINGSVFCLINTNIIYVIFMHNSRNTPYILIHKNIVNSIWITRNFDGLLQRKCSKGIGDTTPKIDERTKRMVWIITIAYTIYIYIRITFSLKSFFRGNCFWHNHL